MTQVEKTADVFPNTAEQPPAVNPPVNPPVDLPAVDPPAVDPPVEARKPFSFNRDGRS